MTDLADLTDLDDFDDDYDDYVERTERKNDQKDNKNKDNEPKFEHVSRLKLTKHVQEYQETLRKDLPFMLKEGNEGNRGQEMKRVDMLVKNKQQQFISVVHGVMSKDECESYISACEKLQFSSIEHEYKKDYRSSTRLVSFSDQFAQTIWNRISTNFNDDDLAHLQPYGFMIGGDWVPVGINPCLRFTKYNVGDKFAKHKDGKYVKNDDLQSILTVMIYLNDDFFGGHTQFEYTPEESNYLTRKDFIPETGMALIFKHEHEHAGLEVSKKYHRTYNTYPKDSQRKLNSSSPDELAKMNAKFRHTKYVLRMDIMFQRIDEFYLDRTYHLEPQYQLAEKYYWESIRLQQQGKPNESTKSYLKAQEIQHNFFKEAVVGANNNNRANNNDNAGSILIGVPDNLFKRIFGTYMNKDTMKTCTTVCDDWNHKIENSSNNNALWREQYLKRWPIALQKNTHYEIIYKKKTNNKVIVPQENDEEKNNDEKEDDNNDNDNNGKKKNENEEESWEEEESWVGRHSLLLPTNVTINWKYAYKYREEADQKFRPTVIMIEPEMTYYKLWDQSIMAIPTLIRYSCGHMWCAGSGSENCLVGYDAQDEPDRDDYFDDKTYGLYAVTDDDNKYVHGAPNSKNSEGKNIHWTTVRAVIKHILMNPEFRHNDVEHIYDDVHHNWIERTRSRRPLVIIRTSWMTDEIVSCLEEFTIGELGFPYVWILDFADLSNVTHEPLKVTLSKINITDEDMINKNLQQIWELSQLPETLDNFKTMADRIDWSNYF